MTLANQHIGLNPADPFIAGDTPLVRVTVKAQDGTPFDLTGASIRWELFAFPDYLKRDAEPGTVPILAKTLGSGITIAGPGLIDVALAPADTALLKGGYWHEVELVTASGAVHTPTTGIFLITRQRVI